MVLTPPTSAATQGVPNSMASPRELGELSTVDGSVNTFARRYCSRIPSGVHFPRNVILSPRWYCSLSSIKYLW